MGKVVGSVLQPSEVISGSGRQGAGARLLGYVQEGTVDHVLAANNLFWACYRH